MDVSDSLRDFLRRARRRYIANLALDQLAFAVSLGMGGVVVLLLLGTQIFEWYWPAVLLAGSLAFGLIRTFRRLPSCYRLAQLIDRRLHLHDALSTAFYFSQVNGSRLAPEALRQAQWEMANHSTRSADIKRAAPYAVPRRIYAAGAMAVLAFGMVALRYGIHRTLDLRQPLAPGFADLLRFDSRHEALARAKKPVPTGRPEDRWRDPGISLDEPRTDLPDDGADRARAVVVENPADRGAASKESKSKDWAVTEKFSQSGQGSEENGTEESNEENEAASGADSRQEADPSPARNGKPQQAPQFAPPRAQQSQENSGLMDKMRDAMASLLDKLKIQPRSNGAPPAASAGQRGARQESRRQASRQQGTPSPGQSQGEGQRSQDMQGDPQGQANQKAQNGNGKSGPQNADRSPSPDAKSGIGREDGAKGLREAQQLAAMGKISEILGRRSASVTGDVMVEVRSGKQDLRTEYTQKRAAHAEAAGEIHRDEVPLAYQSYVQQYFEQVRKTKK